MTTKGPKRAKGKASATRVTPGHSVNVDHDNWVLGVVHRHPNLLVPHFLVHSYLYYVLDRPLISDLAFDAIVSALSENWEVVQHPHKHLIDRTLLKTGFYLEYPSRVPGAAARMLEELGGGGKA